jgi:DNA polymerase III epsilon subunit-like protein
MVAPQEQENAAPLCVVEADVCLPINTFMQESATNVGSPLTKQERGRYKKLLKRATTVVASMEPSRVSGISSHADWIELLHLQQKNLHHYQMSRGHRCAEDVPNPEKKSAGTFLPGIQMLWKTENTSQQRTVEAKLHRDLLLQLIHTIVAANVSMSKQSAPSKSSGKKRKRIIVPTTALSLENPIHDSIDNATTTNSLPQFQSNKWVCIHNPVAVSHLAVVELHVSTDADAARIQQCICEYMATIPPQQSRTVMTVPTHWFHANQTEPQSMAHTLMYVPEGTSPLATSCVDQESVFCMSDLICRLEPFIMSKERLLHENYPIDATSIDTNSSPKPNTCQGPLLPNKNHSQPPDFSEPEALFFIRPFQTRTHDHESKPSLPPYVVRKAEKQDVPRRIFGIDCEMVETAQGLELARVTICELTDWTGDDIALDDPYKFVTRLDVIVQPRNRIHNYLTQYSGITASSYQSTPIVRLEQVQAQLLSLIHPMDIVIGHSLENDLHALRWIHPTVIDTAILFQNASKNRPSFKYSLRHLAAVLLKRQIQNSERPHCSVEDAATAMELAIRRAVHGPSFGISQKNGNMSNWLADVSRSTTAVCVGPITWLQQHILSSTSALHALQCESVRDSNLKAVVSWLAGPKRRASIVWSQLDLTTTATKNMKSSSDLDTVGIWLQEMIAKVPDNVVVMVAVQVGYPPARAAAELRRTRRNPRASVPWSDAEEQQYQSVLETCRNGTVLWIGGRGIAMER